MAPLIPYKLLPWEEAPEIPLSFLKYVPLLNRLIDPAHPPSLKVFGALVALGVYIGSAVAMRHARERRLSEKKMNEFIFWILAGGFLGAHVLDAIFYHPGRLAREPLYLFKLWEGLSSYGGFIGAVLGALAWRARRREPILGFCEVVNSAFPLAWVFGRAGCASVHDHPGMRSDLWFAVRWPVGTSGHFEGRLDLGLIEMTLTIPLAVAFAILWRRKPERPLGFYTGIMCAAYAPVRFCLDFLREDERDLLGGDARYGGLTPAQWACFGLLAMGIYFLRIWWKGRRRAAGPDAAEADVAGVDRRAVPVKRSRRKRARADEGTASEAPPQTDAAEQKTTDERGERSSEASTSEVTRR